MFKAAIEVRKNAYSPYSNFKVGAAIRTASGNVYTGCNVENVAYPEGTCAEAGAIAAMIAAGESKIVEVLVVAGGSQRITPCGGCRQKIAEFADDDAKILLANLDGDTDETTMGALLPGSFDKSHIEKS